MIIIKSSREIECMRKAGSIVGEVFDALEPLCKPGITTKELAHHAEKVIRSRGAKPTFLHYGGFEGAICISVNDEIIHGIPGARKLKEGDIVSLDVGATYDGYCGDACRTYGVGKVSSEAQKLMEVTKESFFQGVRFAKPGNHLGDISHAIQEYAEKNGYSVLKDFTGHGIGRNLHEDPSIPNYGNAGFGPILKPGMCLAIEPMIMQGSDEYIIMEDGWTTKTKDKMLSAHYENTIVITEQGYEILTFGIKEEKHG